MKNYKIAIDVMGGDYAPKAAVEGAGLALQKHPELSVVLVGHENEIRAAMQEYAVDASRVTVLHKDAVVPNDEHNPAEAARSNRDSSMMTVMRMVRAKEVDAALSAGNTGAVLAGATIHVGRLCGVQRPAFAIAFPGRKGPVYILDVGANVDCKPQYLVQFAEMMTIYYRKQCGKQKPTVGLLNIGTEEAKGNELCKTVYPLLKEDPDIHFIGNIEGNQILESAADIIVTDGFAGNIMLKTTEGTAAYIMSLLKEAIGGSLLYKIGALLMKPALREMKKKLDPSQVGGAPMLGLDGVVIKAHGNSKGPAFASAIDQCIAYLENNVNGEITEMIAAKKALASAKASQEAGQEEKA